MSQVQVAIRLRREPRVDAICLAIGNIIAGDGTDEMVRCGFGLAHNVTVVDLPDRDRLVQKKQSRIIVRS